MSVTLGGAVYDLLDIPCVISTAPLFRPKINLTTMTTFRILIERHISQDNMACILEDQGERK
jgi:hypothetical protein